MKGVVGASVMIVLRWQSSFAGMMALSPVCVDAGVIERISLHFRVCDLHRENGPLIHAFLSRYCEVQREPISLQFCKESDLVRSAVWHLPRQQGAVAVLHIPIKYFNNYKGVYG